MDHGIVDVFAYQEALLIEAAFGIALLTMIWIGFRRWLHHKEYVDRLTAEATAERSAQYRDRMEGVEARLKAIEETLPEAGIEPNAQLERTRSDALPNPLEPDEG